MEGKPVPTVLLRYTREGDLSTGDLFLVTGDDYQYIQRFDNVEFKKMLTFFARALKQHPEAIGCITRMDKPGLIPYVLDVQSATLFREDPVAAIQSMTYTAPAAVTELKLVRDTTPIETAPIRVGFNTLADSFGDVLYALARVSSLECPGCGYWGVSREGLFRCEKMCVKRGIAYDFHISLSKYWAGFEVKELLCSELSRFFFPRAWNAGHTFISREKLIEKFNDFQTEKEAACSLKVAIR